jgi:hypothetical protein
MLAQLHQTFLKSQKILERVFFLLSTLHHFARSSLYHHYSMGIFSKLEINDI